MLSLDKNQVYDLNVFFVECLLDLIIKIDLLDITREKYTECTL